MMVLTMMKMMKLVTKMSMTAMMEKMSMNGLRAVILEGEYDWVLGSDECRFLDGENDVPEADV